MKTTLDLPDELMRRIKVRAARENRTLEDTVAELLRLGMMRRPAASKAVAGRVQLPRIHCAHEAAPDEEMTPERVAAILLDEERDNARG